MTGNREEQSNLGDRLLNELFTLHPYSVNDLSCPNGASAANQLC